MIYVSVPLGPEIVAVSPSIVMSLHSVPAICGGSVRVRQNCPFLISQAPLIGIVPDGPERPLSLLPSFVLKVVFVDRRVLLTSAAVIGSCAPDDAGVGAIAAAGAGSLGVAEARGTCGAEGPGLAAVDGAVDAEGVNLPPVHDSAYEHTENDPGEKNEVIGPF